VFLIYNKKGIYTKNDLKIKWGLGIGDWGLGIGEWGVGIGPNPQSPIPNPPSPIPKKGLFFFFNIFLKKNL